MAHKGSDTIARHQPVAMDLIAALVGCDIDNGAARLALNACNAMPPAEFDQARCQAGIDQPLLQIVLLKIDEGRVLVPRLRQIIELEQLPVSVQHLAQMPTDAFFQQLLAQTQPSQYFQTALGKNNRTRSIRNLVILIDHQRAHPPPSQIQSQHQPHQPRTSDDNSPFNQ
ncbi:hypothetical protein CV_1802 [Chromobacterium violaceum ATCC 12472]|uniref:Uncharacterized protein n=1 Tax=Chromobacterium violaceum (strain ATCC 12472 / DSM 30191 / JCM 1249 / CCUG 213 / NBRC 12614 / NCIMB 9131 / NCTC 9757 / MK) TaxID=243365 RepID=Q7NX27_CHRVO|nr:hypothetical protein CV_1802 [Chromobacterium violaceum ATCC 12472]